MIIARFVTRGISDTGLVDLLLGAALKEQTHLKPNCIYQIEQYFGELVIRDMGESAIKTRRKDSSIDACWCQDLNSLICNKTIFLTKEEATKG